VDSNELALLTNKLCNAVRHAGLFIAGELELVGEQHIIEKELHSLVSYVDIEAEKKLVEDLKKLIPDSGFITEENTAGEMPDSDFTWIIDPLDGTTNFLKGIPVFGVSVALLNKQKLISGAVYHIMQDEMFYAWSGGGAFLNGKPIGVSRTLHLKDAVVATGFPYKVKNMNELAGILQYILDESRGVRRMGSAAIDLAYTACGRFDCYYEAAINPWDVAAGILLVREAGGHVTDMDGGREPLFARNILAANSNLLNPMLTLIEKVRNQNNI